MLLINSQSTDASAKVNVPMVSVLVSDQTSLALPIVTQEDHARTRINLLDVH